MQVMDRVTVGVMVSASVTVYSVASPGFGVRGHKT